MESAFPGISRELISGALGDYLKTKLDSSNWIGWDGPVDVGERIRRFWESEDDPKKQTTAAHTILRRGILKTLAPRLPDWVKLDMLFRMAYPLPDNPYEIGTGAYLNLLKDYQEHRSERIPECILSGKLQAADRRYMRAFYAASVLIIGLAVGMSVSTLVRDKKTTRYEGSDPDIDKSKRQQSRGAIGSIIVSFFFGTLNFLVDKYGAINPATSTALVGMCFGGTLGFLMDNTIGSDTGFRLTCERGRLVAWKYALGMMSSPAYLRYTLTVLLDLFISLIMFKPLYVYICRLPFFRCNNQALANGLASTLIGILTFQAYANKTRFAWAYPSTDSQSKDSWIRGGTMQVAVSVASVVFLISNTRVNPGETGINHPRVKLAVVIGVMCLIWSLTKSGEMQPRLDIDVVPDNIFKVSANKRYRPGDLVAGSEVREIATQSPLDGEFVVESDIGAQEQEKKYKIVRRNPAFTYVRSKQRTVDDILSHGPRGAIALIALGVVAFGVTILGTSTKSRQEKVRLFAAFMILTVALAVPGFLP